MTDDDPAAERPEFARNAAPETWEAVGRRALCDVLRDRQRQVDRAVGQVVSAVEYGAPVDTQFVVDLRRTIEALEVVVEADLVKLVGDDDLTAWERTPERVPFGRIAGMLGVDAEALNDALEAVAAADEVDEDGRSEGDSNE